MKHLGLLLVDGGLCYRFTVEISTNPFTIA